jgi:hypothetical protein
MTAASRVQVLYDERELNGRTQVQVQRVSLRFDGPSGGTARAHVIERLTLQLGATGMASTVAGSVFADNLTQALATPLRDVRFNYASDGNVVAGPEPFGGSGGELTFLLPQPVTVNVPTGGALVLELACAGNDNVNDSARLDLFDDPANMQKPGASIPHGRGCPLSATLPGPVLDTEGSYEPGGSLSIVGRGFAPNSPVSFLVTARVFANALAFPNTTPVCWAYVDPGTTLLSLTATASGSGSVRGGDALPIPKLPAAAGAVIYVQSVTPVMPFTGNAFGLASSNYRTLEVGLLKAPTAGVWFAGHPSDAQARIATVALYGGLALRLE